ncbi:M23 family metallopeptidase [Flavobacterium selenitireducens]|uniref:M23 family metallopeptidase n=1 Tax=Flavobacterium selenitireducens TaxID=2722704 RepID=UPI00168B9B03|nr:M23 family metallopeptidase [Flavobacterium selenitireducens]MBD3582781.1 M23 family metallopeptidase [Flavobacterium selenitireducens]
MRFFLLLSFLYAPIYAQDVYPKDFFRSPLDIPLQLSGNFGELRSNHFHAGFDFRTQQKEGLNIYASGDGYISRIKISPYGYGKAIYIDHPNGFTTVYGHLKMGSATVEKYIREAQYKQESFEVELFPKPDELKVAKGDIIALSGNTGGSEGPHLHFEIRDTKSEKIINPLFFGFDKIILDNKKPVLQNLLAYPIDANSEINGAKVPVMVDIRLAEDGSYIAEKITANGRIGFGISAYDKCDYSPGKNGVYKVENYVNGQLSYGYEFNTFAFDESRYINALIDYPRYRKTGQRVQRLFRRQSNDFSLIRTDESNGAILMDPNMNKVSRLEISDFYGNNIVINIPIEYALPATAAAAEAKSSGYLVSATRDTNLEKGGFSVFVPAKSFYEDTFVNFEVDGNVMTFGNDDIPVHSSFNVTIDDRSIAEQDREKTFVASVNGSRLGYNSTKRKGSTFSTYTKNMGAFKLAKDVDAPKITSPKKIEGKLVKEGSISFTISDALSGIKDYKGYLNGKWVLFEFDYKSRRITHWFSTSDHAVDGRNDLKLVVTDNVGNSAIFETYFLRSQTP